MTDLLTGLGDFFNGLFGAFGGGAAQPSQEQTQQYQQHRDADLFGQLFQWLPDGGQQMSKAFEPPREVQPWEEPPTLQSVQLRSYDRSGGTQALPFVPPSKPREPARLGAPVSAAPEAPQKEASVASGVPIARRGMTSYVGLDAQSDDTPETEPPRPGEQAYWESTRAPAVNPTTKTLSVREEMRRNRSPHFTAQANPSGKPDPDFAKNFDPTKVYGRGNHGQTLTRVYAPDGTRANMNTKYASRFQGLINDLHAAGYTNFDLFNGGGYADRSIRGSKFVSNHAFGDAIDINPSKNPMGRGPLKSDMPKNISQLAAKWGLKWGGDWQGRKDPMHFEVDRRLNNTEIAALRAWTQQASK